MCLAEENAGFVMMLVQAAEEHGVVADLLDLIDRSIAIDGIGNKEIVGGQDDLELLIAAQIAAMLSRYNRNESEEG